MSVNLDPLARFHPLVGIQLGTYAAGIRYKGRDDMLIIELAEQSHTAAVFTQNHFAAPAIQIARKHLNTGQPRYLLYLAGNANAATGRRGMEDMQGLCQKLAGLCRVPVHQILPFTTGVIGAYLPVDKIKTSLNKCHAKMAFNQWEEAARAIMTTDTQAKGISRQFTYHDHRFTINGIAKGSGMIAPNMATMLAFIATDAYVPADTLKDWMYEINNSSFNAITIDGDTSTNDAFMISATGCKRHDQEYDVAFLALLKNKLMEAAIFLAQQIVRDGEGASKFITIIVEQARDAEEAQKMARVVAHSPLVKTALFASDPNWGRILMAAGNAGLEHFNPDQFDLLINYVSIVEQGIQAPGYHEQLGKTLLSQPEIVLLIRLGRGTAHTRLWTCDFSYDYIKINAAYRT